MDTRWERRPPLLPPPRRPRDYASFSASLLDAIYRSLDDASAAAAAAAERDDAPGPDRPPPRSPPPMKPPPAEFWWAPRAAANRRAETPRHRPVRSNRIRPDPPLPQPPPPPPPPPPIETKSPAPKPRSIRRRLRELRKGRGSSSSSSSNSSSSSLACLLRALFTSAGHLKKDKIPAPAADPETETETEPACSSARSCLSARRRSAAAAEGGTPKRSVRFHPASVIVDEDSRPCGHRSLRGADNSAAPAAAAAERRVEEVLRAPAAAAEESSDSSSDLFELENLTAVAGRTTTRFAVSLPAAPPSAAIQSAKF